MRVFRWALVSFVLGMAVSAASAQTGGIKVIVTDDVGMELPGATVTISNELGYVKTTAQLTNKNGIAEFPILRAGQGYAIQVSFPGFAPTRNADIRVRIGDMVTLPVQMIEEFQERVKVTATRDVIDLETTEQSTKFSENFIADLPVPGRFYQNVLTMAPGVQDADGDGNPNVHGSRARDFKTVVSGVSNVDPLTGQWMSNINPNSIEEMEVITAGAGVEFGRAQGGFSRIIQKQGSNTHEGVFEFYYRTSKLDGTGAADNSNLPDPGYEWIQPSVLFSGPVVRDKLWYRVSGEIRQIEDPINIVTGIGIFERDEKNFDGALTWQVSPRNKLALGYRKDNRQWTNFGISSFVPEESSRYREFTPQTTSLTWTAPYSPKVLVESTVAWTDDNQLTAPTTSGSSNDCVGGGGVPEFLKTAQCQDLNTGRVSGAYNVTNADHRQRLGISGRATVYGGRFAGMNHQLQLGLGFENERYFRELNWSPSLSFLTVNIPADDPTDPESTPQTVGFAIGRLSVPENESVRATGTNWHIFAEDQFRPAQNLTVTIGARVDREEINSEGREVIDTTGELSSYETAIAPPSSIAPSEAYPPSFTGYEDYDGFEREMQALLCEGVPSDSIGQCFELVKQSIINQNAKSLDQTRRARNLNIENTNISPYLSLAWSPWSNGKTAFKFAAGRHYNNIPLIIPVQELNPVFTDLVYRVDLSTGNAALESGITPNVNTTTVDADIRTPYQDEFTFSIERELWAETQISVTYVNRKYRDQIQDENANIDLGDYGQCVVQNNPTVSPVMAAPGESSSFTEDNGDWLTDAFTQIRYPDTDPGVGDGLDDDCVGEILALNVGLPDSEDPDDVVQVQRPDGITDLYVQNPFWGDIFVIGNFNEHDYEAWVLNLVRRQYRSWEMQASYTWSKAEGNGEDFFQAIGDDPTLAPNVRGFQSYDQRHVVKLNATTITPWGLRLGTAISWQSGLPYSLQWRRFSFDTLPPSTKEFGINGGRTRTTYPTELRNDQRNDSYWNVDLRATKEFNLGRGLNLQVSAEVFNLLNDGTYQVYNPFLERGVQVNGSNEANPRFGRRWQLGMKLAF